MNRELKCVMLVDDDSEDNFFHERAIKKISESIFVVKKTSGKKALDFLKAKNENIEPHPDLIFLDINMPGMNGFEFLEEYYKLDKELQSFAIVMMLTNSQNPNDKARAKTWGFVVDYITKPLTEEIMREIIGKYFKSETILG